MNRDSFKAVAEDLFDNESNLKSICYTIIISLSAGLFLLALINPDLFYQNIKNNRIARHERDFFFAALTTISASISIIIIGSHFLRLFRIPDFLSGISRYRFLAILGFLPIIANKPLWAEHENLYLFILAAAGLWLLFSFNEWPHLTLPKTLAVHERGTVWLALSAGILFYGIHFSYYSIINHYRFGTRAYDLGIVVNYFWNSVQGRFLECSYFYPDPHWFSGAHFSLTPIVLIGPLFKALPAVETLLVSQAAFLALGAVPVYLIANHLLRNRYFALVIALCYLLHPAMHCAVFYDFHEISMLPLLGGMLIYFWLRGSAKLFLFLPPVLLLKEDMVYVVLIYALFFLFRKESRSTALITIAICLIWHVVLFNLILPSYHYAEYTGWRYTDINPHGGSAIEMIKTVLINPFFTLQFLTKPTTITYFWQMVLPLALLPVLRPRYLLLILYGVVVNGLCSRWPATSIGFQYVWYLIPGLYAAYSLVLRDIQEKQFLKHSRIKPGAVLAVTLLLTVVLSYEYGAILNREKVRGGFNQNIDFEYNDEHRLKRIQLQEFADAHIPPEASLAAEELLCAQLSTRRTIYSFQRLKIHVDYILLWRNHPRKSTHFRNWIENSNRYDRLAAEHGFVIYRNRSLRGS